MAITFHEGLPGAGKSYEACSEQILPALLSGRSVITNIEGINHARFSQATGIPLPLLRKILICVDNTDIVDPEERVEAQKQAFIDLTPKDSLVVIDEIQNLFPAVRQKLDPNWQRFISEHRHDGLDIILMGQDRRDCHSMWRRRVELVVTFLKQTALGRPDSYRWETHQCIGPDKYQKISSGSKKYDPQYFGLYSSHTEGTHNKATKLDDRANIFKTGKFKAFAAAVLVLPVLGIYGTYNVFADPSAVASTQESQPAPASASQGKYSTYKPQPAPTQAPKPKPTPTPPPKPKPIDAFDQANQEHRLRLSGYLHGQFQGKFKFKGRIEVLDTGLHLIDVFTIDAVQSLGWVPTHKPHGLELTKGDKTILVRQWPVDPWGRTNQGRVDSLASK